MFPGSGRDGRAGGCDRPGNAISCSYPMQRGEGQRRGVGPGSDGPSQTTDGWRRAIHGCEGAGVLGLPRVRSTAEDAEIGIERTSREAPNSGSSASSAVDLAFLPGRHGWRTWGARNAISRSYPMQRGAGRRRRVGRVQTGTAGRRTWRTTDWGVRSGPGQGARVANPRQDTMIRETVRFGGADGGVRSGKGHGSRIPGRIP